MIYYIVTQTINTVNYSVRILIVILSTFAYGGFVMKKKIAFLTAVLLVVLLFCLTGCNTDFKFSKLELTAENVTAISVSFGDAGSKSTATSSKIEKIIGELNNLEIEKYKEEVNDNIFTDSVIGIVTIEQEGKSGSFVMTFAQTTLVDNTKVALLKCEAKDGFKIKNMPKDIYQMSSVDDTNALLSKLFANYI